MHGRRPRWNPSCHACQLDEHTRRIIHIANAPGHSRALHDMAEARDQKYYKPGSEPHGLTYNPVIKLLVQLGINYTFLQIYSCTDRMLKAFSGVYKAAGGDCQLLPTNTYYENQNAGLCSNFGRSGTLASRANKGNSPQLLFQELPMGIDVGSLQRLDLQSVSDSVIRTSSRCSIALSGNKVESGAIPRSNGRLNHQPPLSTVREDEEETSSVCLETGPPQWNSPGWLDKK
ncbi:hypothetical protein F4824DRAFT_303613 [Ustulina deusta]|nr:hypothetical protein F4824DRAFT_303613 [Ustulina deusta]